MLTRSAQVALALLGLDCGGGAARSGSDGQPLIAATWSFVPIAAMTCADGSSTGIGVNLASIPVTLIAESGPPLSAPFLASALEEAWRVGWGLDGTKSAAAPSTHLFPYLQWMAQTYPDRRLGFVDMTGDLTVALFLNLELAGESSLSNGLFNSRQLLQRRASNISFFFVPSRAPVPPPRSGELAYTFPAVWKRQSVSEPLD